jgi:hypothetical protein
MFAEVVFVNYHNFNPILGTVHHASIHEKNPATQVKKGHCQGILQNLFGAGAGAERNIFGSATLEKLLTQP